MEITAHLSNARMTPRKMRLVRDVLVGMSASDAEIQLRFMNGKASQLIGGVLRSAIANAENNFELKRENLRVANVLVNEGIRFKRYMPASRGMAHPYAKRTSHVTVVLDEIKPSKKSTTKKKRVTEIETVSADDFVKQAPVEEEQEIVPEKIEDTGRSVEAKPEANLGAYEKTKMQQQGGARRIDKKRRKGE